MLHPAAFFEAAVRLSPLTGRTEQVSAAIRQELENTMKGDGRVVGVVGEAGIGKSRLCFEFAENCRERVSVSLRRVCWLTAGQRPFSRCWSCCATILGFDARQAADVARRRVLDQLQLFRSRSNFRLVLLEFLGLADPQQRRPSSSIPKTRKTQLLDFVRTLPRSGQAECHDDRHH